MITSELKDYLPAFIYSEGRRLVEVGRNRDANRPLYIRILGESKVASLSQKELVELVETLTRFRDEQEVK